MSPFVPLSVPVCCLCVCLFCIDHPLGADSLNSKRGSGHPWSRGLGPVTAQDDDSLASMREQVLGLAELKSAPKIYESPDARGLDGVRPIYFEGLPWRGKKTRVFALLGLPNKPSGQSDAARVPGVVLVHGGGGTAFLPWVKKWNDKGFAAISIAVEGQTDRRDQEGKKWARHQWGGPERQGIYGDSDLPLKEQWMYHSVADTILAHSLLRSLPQVDSEKVGVVGISWGGVIASTVIGIDQRFSFAVPTYGCGDLAESANQYGRALGENQVYRKVWDPMVRMDKVSIPVLWLTWPSDLHFPMDSLKNCYDKAKGPHMVAMIPGMNHGHGAGWNPPDSYAFAESIVNSGEPWCVQHGVLLDGADGMSGRLSFDTIKPVSKASLVTTTDLGFTGSRKWVESPAEFIQGKGRAVVTVSLPPETTAWFVNVNHAGSVASSDFQIVK